MDEITKATRRQSYEKIMPTCRTRVSQILDILGSRKMTASEITEEMLTTGKIPYFNRNCVAPRLTELRALGIVETVGRRQATRSNATEAVWARKATP